MMTGRPETEDHIETDNVERGLRFLDETPRHLRGPSVPALKRLGLSAKDACEVLRIHGMKMARAG
ncbi:hypothetical protein [Mesorhizobium delmotii]|uniref:Uncharacterized protein n=1 Tax=Mesorhizobium delmotii TaxID=1631247 RepID=A0A2P9APM9_9HYPH|nr:hypothetical protein [Mesorhizobium delmotii]SJM33124.1 conserved hypothetical protein [Mesorhizobium delmotii]